MQVFRLAIFRLSQNQPGSATARKACALVSLALLGDRRIVSSWSPPGSDCLSEPRQVIAYSGFRATISLDANGLIERSDILLSGSPLRVQKRQIGGKFAPTVAPRFGKVFSLRVLHGGLFVNTKPSDKSVGSDVGIANFITTSTGKGMAVSMASSPAVRNAIEKNAGGRPNCGPVSKKRGSPSSLRPAVPVANASVAMCGRRLTGRST